MQSLKWLNGPRNIYSTIYDQMQPSLRGDKIV